MSLRPQDPLSVPEETRRVAQAAFPKGTLCLHIADALGPVYQDSQFKAVFPRHGSAVDAPRRGKLVSAHLLCFGRLPVPRVALLLPLLLALAACALFGPGTPDYVVFFPERSAQLDAAAQGVVAQAAQRARDNLGARVRVIGYTDSAGGTQADVALSRQRAQAVADALVADGVEASRLVRAGRGQTKEDPGVASRRVEISVGGAS